LLLLQTTKPAAEKKVYLKYKAQHWRCYLQTESYQ